MLTYMKEKGRFNVELENKFLALKLNILIFRIHKRYTRTSLVLECLNYLD